MGGNHEVERHRLDAPGGRFPALRPGASLRRAGVRKDDVQKFSRRWKGFHRSVQAQRLGGRGAMCLNAKQRDRGKILPEKRRGSGR